MLRRSASDPQHPDELETRPRQEAATASTSNPRHLAVVLAAAAATLLADVVAAYASGSLALVADAAHRLTDVFGVSVAFVAATIAARPATESRSFGWARAEVIAACVNAGLLMGMGLLIGAEAIGRILAPEVPEPGPMAIAALIGLVGSAASVVVLRGEHSGFAARGAFLDVVGDCVGSIAALLAAGLIAVDRVALADPIASLAVTALVVPRSIFLLRDGIEVLLESTPKGLSLPAVRARILRVPGVAAVHDLHAWQITAGLPMVSAHVVLKADADFHGVLDAVDNCLAEDFDMEHSTLQLEPADHDLEAAAHE